MYSAEAKGSEHKDDHGPTQAKAVARLAAVTAPAIVQEREQLLPAMGWHRALYTLLYNFLRHFGLYHKRDCDPSHFMLQGSERSNNLSDVTRLVYSRPLHLRLRPFLKGRHFTTWNLTEAFAKANVRLCSLGEPWERDGRRES